MTMNAKLFIKRMEGVHIFLLFCLYESLGGGV